VNPYVRRGIALFQVVGGFLGVFLAASVAVEAAISWELRLRFALIALLFLLSYYAGQALWRDKPRGYLLSVMLHVPQTLLISTPAFTYEFSVGASIGAWFSGPWIQPLWSLGSHFEADWRTAARPTAIGINLIAVLFLIQLIKGWHAQRAGTIPAHRATPV
jgi:uncharacterized membrane protein